MSEVTIHFRDNRRAVKGPERGKPERAVYVSMKGREGHERGSVYGALDLDEAKAARVALNAAIAAAEERIEEAKHPREPQAQAVVKFKGRVPAYRDFDDKWRFTGVPNDPRTWDELLAYAGTDFEILYPTTEEDES